MPLATIATTGLGLLAVAVAALFVAAVWRAPDGAAPAERRGTTALALAVALVVLGLTGTLAAGGALADVDARPPLAALLLGALGVGLAALAFSRVGDRLLAWPLGALVGVQALRIVVEALLYAGFRGGAIPVEMTAEGHNFDVVTGVLALGIAAWAARGTVPRAVVAAWNGLGLVLLVVVVATAASSAFGFVTTTPRLTLPTTWPGVWLPGWIVPMALFGHMLVFRALRRDARA